MGKEEIVNRILADADAEAAEIIAAAEARAAEIVAHAEANAARAHAETEEEASERAQRISDGKAAAARLDTAKIVLAEKRRVLGEIYERALSALLALGKGETLALLERLLCENAETGDEILLPEGVSADDVKGLPVVRERGLTVSPQRADIRGGCLLHGKKSDKDLSYPALLSADMEEHQAELAAKLFRGQ